MTSTGTTTLTRPSMWHFGSDCTDQLQSGQLYVGPFQLHQFDIGGKGPIHALQISPYVVRPTRTTRGQNSNSFIPISCNKDTYKYSYFERHYWNGTTYQRGSSARKLWRHSRSHSTVLLKSRVKWCCINSFKLYIRTKEHFQQLMTSY
jgi:hypothetical protein